jgi:hypothetical protein
MSPTITDDAVPSTLCDNSGMLLPELADQQDADDDETKDDLSEFPASVSYFQSHI